MEEWNSTEAESELFVDTATVVSIGSSCVILISGCIAVVCLILYMKRSEQQLVPRAVCAKCGQRVESMRSVGVITDAPVESALYAISGAIQVKEEPLLGVICGHVSDTHTTYSTDAPHVKIPRSQGSQDSELVYLSTRERRKLSFESFEVYESVVDSEERDTPTDPGIRQFTESPPKPNERRQGVVQHITNEEFFGALPRYRSRQPQWKLSSECQTLKCLSSMSEVNDSLEVNGLSSDDDFQTIDC